MWRWRPARELHRVHFGRGAIALLVFSCSCLCRPVDPSRLMRRRLFIIFPFPLGNFNYDIKLTHTTLMTTLLPEIESEKDKVGPFSNRGKAQTKPNNLSHQGPRHQEHQQHHQWSEKRQIGLPSLATGHYEQNVAKLLYSSAYQSTDHLTLALDQNAHRHTSSQHRWQVWNDNWHCSLALRHWQLVQSERKSCSFASTQQVLVVLYLLVNPGY